MGNSLAKKISQLRRAPDNKPLSIEIPLAPMDMIEEAPAPTRQHKSTSARETKTARRKKIPPTYSAPPYNRALYTITSISTMYSLHDAFTNYKTLCRIPIDEIYDGDTVQCVLPMPLAGNPICKCTLRLTGFDAPEMKVPMSIDFDVRARMKRSAVGAKTALAGLLQDKTLILHAHGLEKYGRIIGEVYVFNGTVGDPSTLAAYLIDPRGDVYDPNNYMLSKEKSVSYYMIENGYAQPYAGGTKGVFDDAVHKSI